MHVSPLLLEAETLYAPWFTDGQPFEHTAVKHPEWWELSDCLPRAHPEPAWHCCSVITLTNVYSRNGDKG